MHSVRALLLVSTTAALASCQIIEYRPPAPLEVEEIVQLSKTGSAPQEIIREIRNSQTVYRMDSDDVIELHKAGVNKDVIDYMMETEKMAAERRYRYHYDPYYYGSPHHHYHHHPHYGWCY